MVSLQKPIAIEVFRDNFHIRRDITKNETAVTVKGFTFNSLHEGPNLLEIRAEQVALGYSKMLPQIALGHSQSSILATAYFENQILDLASVFVPPTSSNNISAEAQKKQGGNTNNKENLGEEKKAGRKELENDQKSEKTIANRESMN